MSKILSVIIYEFFETIRQPKNLLVLFFLVVLYESDLSPIKDICHETGFTLNLFEAFILMCTRSINIILIPLIFIVLMSGFPNCKADYFRMVRISRREWLIGEISFLFLISLVMMIILLIGTIVPIINCVNTSNRWSAFMTSLNDRFPEIYMHNARVTLDASIITHSLPLSALVYSFLIMWMNLMICGSLMLLGAVTSKRMTFLTAALASAFIGGCSTYFKSGIKWIFPIAHTQLGLHFNSIFSKVNFPVYMSYIYLAAVIVVIIGVCGRLIKKMMFTGDGM